MLNNSNIQDCVHHQPQDRHVYRNIYGILNNVLDSYNVMTDTDLRITFNMELNNHLVHSSNHRSVHRTFGTTMDINNLMEHFIQKLNTTGHA